jgi:hypothetical protein
MIKTQYCQNCEATERRFSDFRQEVSNEVICYFGGVELNTRLHRFIIPKPKPDPLVEVLGDLEWNNNSDECAADLRAALEARGLEIREKNDD